MEAEIEMTIYEQQEKESLKSLNDDPRKNWPSIVEVPKDGVEAQLWKEKNGRNLFNIFSNPKGTFHS